MGSECRGGGLSGVIESSVAGRTRRAVGGQGMAVGGHSGIRYSRRKTSWEEG